MPSNGRRCSTVRLAGRACSQRRPHRYILTINHTSFGETCNVWAAKEVLLAKLGTAACLRCAQAAQGLSFAEQVALRTK